MFVHSASAHRPIERLSQVIPAACPRLPDADAVLPYLRRMDAARTYSNFGPLLTAFEARLAERFETGTAVVTCVNATQALTLTLQALDLPKGGLVAIPSYTFVATAHAVVAAGLIPLFLDVDPEDWMLRPATVREALKQAPGPIAATIVVAAFGAMPDLDGWRALRDETGLPVVLDAAAAFDTARTADIPTVVSLHATKVLGVGEGGFLATTNAGLAARLRQLTTFGFRGARVSDIAATNAKLSEYAGAVGLAALDTWDSDRLRFLRTARLVRAAMTYLPEIRFQSGWGDDWVTSVCSVRLPDGSVGAIERSLQDQDIQTRRWWDRGCHANPAFNECPRGDLQVTETLGRSVLGLPFAVDMGEHEISRVAAALGSALASL
ncbi:aminotransferase class I/II-fold pyridoxal phosphate-dependent enzyme [Brevundimonas sp. AJA228-03]|uniref:DegT/DnrJ/EryC1/StrS family aminotransferase n=1 Tax=Brevundimonas sp. AJA228-03 TaxID=2752515 RepID=UPI001ADFEF41|nr:aminotransferase class I/II-fold pyridoxal phosphate-dependent enzyme [Brevundimonas sp. AJA228-03]QTN20524.1 aminotransferase class I/II-fold pyridoxal phosphate-dependent enzyme [Brevundimonas sp. AJA228-03]